MVEYKSLNDQELTEYLRNGDHLAFNEIYKRYWRTSINAAFQRLKSKENAEEVVQDVFVNLYLRRSQIQPKSSLEAYLKIAIKYRIIDEFRSQKLRDGHLESIIRQEETLPLQPDQEFEYKELREKIRKAADQLPDKCREVFLMSRFEQLSNQEISERTGIAISTVKKHMHKALNILRKDFKDQQLDLLAVCIFIYLSS
jgi:RNA polymerase sigma-70 factor (family 1)